MERSQFESVLKKKVSQITFSGHRVNDDYSLNKRRSIVDVVMSAFDEAAQHSVEPTGSSSEAIPGVCDEIEELWAE